MSLKEMRLEAGLSQSKLARKSDCEVTQISRYETGNASIDNAKLETLCAFAEALGCGIADLLDSAELAERFERCK